MGAVEENVPAGGYVQTAGADVAGGAVLGSDRLHLGAHGEGDNEGHHHANGDADYRSQEIGRGHLLFAGLGKGLEGAVIVPGGEVGYCRIFDFVRGNLVLALAGGGHPPVMLTRNRAPSGRKP